MSALVNIYIKKITGHEINKDTGLPWTVEDVPAKWRDEVKEALEN